MDNIKMRRLGRIEIGTAVSADLPQIRRLQKLHHAKNVSEKTNGFVSRETPVPLLKKIMNDPGIIVAKSNGNVVGYALPVKKEYLKVSENRHVLCYDSIDNLVYDNRKLSDYSTASLQVCVDTSARSIRTVLGIREALAELFKRNGIELITACVSHGNPRALAVFTKLLGAKKIGDIGDWNVLVYDFRQRVIPSRTNDKT